MRFEKLRASARIWTSALLAFGLVSLFMTSQIRKEAVASQDTHKIHYWNREKGKEEVEQVYGDAGLRWVYGQKIGQEFAELVLTKPWLSKAYGSFQSSRLSKRNIEPFIKDFKIPMDEFVDENYYSFNDFFIRKFKEGMRPFTEVASELPAFAEARYFAYDRVDPEEKFPVKGKFLTASGLMGDSEKAKAFENGPLLLARLCPTDYHRFHYPDSGRVIESYRIHGSLHSVNPMALKVKQDILIENERRVSILETEHFGRIAYIEVGALLVGKILQTHPEAEPFERGDEKGYFLFGGSTVIVLGEPGKWVPDTDLLEQTRKGRETLVKLGERIGHSL